MKNKKLLRILWILWICVLVYTNKTVAENYSVGTVDVNFCNYDQTNNELDLVAKAGEKLPICVEFTNKAKVPITINAEFLDSTITEDTIKNRACNAADRPKTQFANFMLPYVWEANLWAQQTIKKEYTIKYPIGFSWLSHWCLAYNIIWADIKNSNMFMIRIRSIKYLDISVSNTEPIQTVDIQQKPTIKKVWDEYSMSIWVNNKGNIDEFFYITSILSNILGYQKENILTGTIPANSWIVLTTKTFILPAYGWPFLLYNKISYAPKFNFNITDGKKKSQKYTWGIKITQKILFIWTRQSGLLLFVLLLFIIKTIHKRYKKKQENTT